MQRWVSAAAAARDCQRGDFIRGAAGAWFDAQSTAVQLGSSYRHLPLSCIAPPLRQLRQLRRARAVKAPEAPAPSAAWVADAIAVFYDLRTPGSPTLLWRPLSAPGGTRAAGEEAAPELPSSRARKLRGTQQRAGPDAFFTGAESPILVQPNGIGSKAVVKQATSSTITVTWELEQVPATLDISCNQCLLFTWNAPSFHGIYADTFVANCNLASPTGKQLFDPAFGLVSFKWCPEWPGVMHFRCNVYQHCRCARLGGYGTCLRRRRRRCTCQRPEASMLAPTAPQL